MSTYLYAFQVKGHLSQVEDTRPEGHRSQDTVDGQTEIAYHCLTFRMASLFSESMAGRRAMIEGQVEKLWEGVNTMPTYFIEGERRDGETVYKATEEIHHPFWVDSDRLPGRAEPIGVLRKIGGRYRVCLETEGQKTVREMLVPYSEIESDAHLLDT